MTIDNAVDHVGYAGQELAVSGDLGNWQSVKRFSFIPIPGEILSITGRAFENGNCGCRCSGLLLSCDNGFTSSLDGGWIASGSSTAFSPSQIFGPETDLCASSSRFRLPEATAAGAVKIWPSSGDKFASFRAIPVPEDSSTRNPTNSPSLHPTAIPTIPPTASPTNSPSVNPTADPTNSPSVNPTANPIQVISCVMTIDNVVDSIKYAGQEVSVTGNLQDWSKTKTFSFTPVPGAALEIAGRASETNNCGCRCSGLLLACSNGFMTDLNGDWQAFGSSSRFDLSLPFVENTDLCQSTSAFRLPTICHNPVCVHGAVKIWPSNGANFARFRAIPVRSVAIDPNAELRKAMRRVFKQVKDSDRTLRLNMPALIRKAFHDAGHFDDKKNKMEMRMGCIKHFFNGLCPQHNGFENAERFRQEVCNRLRSEGFTCPSFPDMIQLLGALAVDEMTRQSPHGADFNRASLFDKVPMGRVDASDEVCMRIGRHEEEHMCKLLPNEIGPNKMNRPGPVREALEETFQTEIAGKMIDRNSFSAREAIALIGAHTVGHHHGFGAWVENPMDFDNAYFQNLELIGNRVGHGKSFRWNPESMDPRPRYSKSMFSTWFQDFAQVKNSSPQENERNFFRGKFGFNNIMMLSADMALITNAWDLVQEFAGSEDAWRRAFDEAYLKMSMLGVDKSTLTFPPAFDLGRRNLLSEEDLDREAEFFQNLDIAREETVAELREFHARRLLRNDHVAKTDRLRRRA